MAWDVLSGVTKTAWDVMSGVTKTTQVNRMSRSRRVLAIGGKQRIFGLDMVCI